MTETYNRPKGQYRMGLLWWKNVKDLNSYRHHGGYKCNIVRNQRDIVSHDPLEVHYFVLFVQWAVSRYSTEDENSGRLEMVQMEATAVWAKKVVM